jgi:hypothetical protein
MVRRPHARDHPARDAPFTTRVYTTAVPPWASDSPLFLAWRQGQRRAVPDFPEPPG